jgi:hypothetical protein
LSSAIRAFLLAAILAAIIASAGLAIYSTVSSPNAVWTLSDAKTFALVLVYCLAISVIAIAFVAVPATALLSRFRLERSWVYPLLGLATAVLIASLLEDRPTDLLRSSELIATIALGFAGLVAGAVWWSLFRAKYASEK